MMVKNQNGRYRYIFLFLVLLVISLTGCREGKQEVTQGTESGIEQVEDDVKPISQTDYLLAQNPVGDSGNLYKLRLVPEEGFVIILYIGEYKDDILTVYQIENGKNYIARFNPFTMVQEARTELPEGMYVEEGVYVMPDGSVAVCNQMSGQVYLMDEELLEYDRISVGQTEAWVSYISQDLKHIFYMDYDAVYSYNTETEDKVTLYENNDSENKYGSLLGVYEEDNCALIEEMEDGNSVCRLIRSDTGETVQSYEADIRKLEAAEDFYMAYCDVDGLTELVFGNEGGNGPKMLFFTDYDEYSYRYADVENGIVISQTERRVAGERQAVLNFYRLDTGMKQYELTVPLLDMEFISGYVTYLKNKNIVVFGLQGEDNGGIYVWDLLAEQSMSADENCYVCDWQGQNPADEEEMELLRTRAQEIGERYGVEIYIGDDVEECAVDIYEYVETDNVVRISQALSILDRTLARYPSGMLAQLDDDYGSVLRIYLAGGILPADATAIDTAVGVQNTLQDDTHLVLDINSVYDYEITICHEIFHAIENHLNMTGTAWMEDDVWNSYNPPDFLYDYDYITNQDSVDFSYVVGNTGQEEQVYFIDVYSKSFPHEDRARIMEYAMMEEKMETGYFEYEVIKNKLTYISGRIRDGFDTTGWPEVTDWEVWIQ